MTGYSLELLLALGSTALGATQVEIAQLGALARSAEQVRRCEVIVSNGAEHYRKECVDLAVQSAIRAIETFVVDPVGRATRALKDIVRCSIVHASGQENYNRNCVEILVDNTSASLSDFANEENPIGPEGWPGVPELRALVGNTERAMRCRSAFSSGKEWLEGSCVDAQVLASVALFEGFLENPADFARDLGSALKCGSIYADGSTYFSKDCVSLIDEAVAADLKDLADLGITQAARAGDAEALRAELELGADPNYANYFGDTPLALAVKGGYLEAARALVAVADLEKAGADGVSPLILAARSRRADLADLLVSAGAKLTSVDGEGNTPLLIALEAGDSSLAIGLVSPESAQLANKGRWTPLARAVESGVLVAARAILAAGASAETPFPSGATPLEYVVANRMRALADLLTEFGANPNGVGNPPLWILLRRPAVYEAERLDWVDWLLRRGADPNLVDSQGATLLNEVLGNAWAPQESGVSLQIMKRLLMAGADANRANAFFGYCQLPLQRAVQFGNVEAIEPLLEAGADINGDDGQCGRPIVVGIHRSHASVRVLLSRHADLGPDRNGWTPVQVAISDWKAGESLDLLDLLTQASPLEALNHMTPYSTGEPGFSALHMAAIEGGTEIVRMFLARGIELNRLRGGYDQMTPLMIAASRVSDTVAKTENWEIARLLIDAGADLNVVGKLRDGTLITALDVVIRTKKSYGRFSKERRAAKAVEKLIKKRGGKRARELAGNRE